MWAEVLIPLGVFLRLDPSAAILHQCALIPAKAKHRLSYKRRCHGYNTSSIFALLHTAAINSSSIPAVAVAAAAYCFTISIICAAAAAAAAAAIAAAFAGASAAVAAVALPRPRFWEPPRRRRRH